MRLRADTDKRLGQQNKMLNVFKTDLEVCVCFGGEDSKLLFEGHFGIDLSFFPLRKTVASLDAGETCKLGEQIQ